MKEETVPHASGKKHVVAGERNVAHGSQQVGGDAQRIVDRPEGIHVDVHHCRAHAGADVVAKARTQQHCGIGMRDGSATFIDFYCCSQFHFKHSLLQRY